MQINLFLKLPLQFLNLYRYVKIRVLHLVHNHIWEYLPFILLNLQKIFKLSLSKVSMENCLNHNDAITDEVKGAWEGMNKKMHILLTNFVYSDNKF